MGHPAEKLATDRFTYGDYREWPEDERWELIHGEAYNMSPAPGTRHQRMVGELHSQLHEPLRDYPCEAFVAPFDVRLPEAGESDDLVDTVVQPDVSIICDKGKLDERGCKGAPDFVAEVLSPHTARKDLTVKRDLYESAGVKEYWIVDPANRYVMIHRLGEEGRYGRPEILEPEGEAKLAAVEGIAIDLARLFGE